MQIIHQAPLAALGLGAAFTVVWGVADPMAAFAEVRVIEADGYYIMGDGPEENAAVAKERARADARRAASEQAGLYVAGMTEVKKGKLTRDEIRTISAAVMEVKEDNVTPEVLGGTVIKYHCHMKAVVDTGSITDQLRQDRANLDAAVQRNMELEKEVERVNAEMAALKQQYAKAGTAEEKERIQQETRVNEAEFESNQWVLKGLEQAKNGDREGALRSYRKAVELNPRNIAAYNAMGGVYNDLGEHSKAIECYQTILQSIDSSHVPSYNNIGVAYCDMGDYRQAISWIEKAISMDWSELGWDRKAQAYVNLGKSYQGVKDYPAALEQFRKAMEISPNNVIAYGGLGRCYYEMEEYRTAVKYLEKAISLHTKESVDYVNLGHSYNELEEYSKAKEAFLKALKLDNENADAYDGLGTAYRNMGEKERAIDCYTKVIEFTKDKEKLFYAYLFRCTCNVSLQRTREALRDANKALEVEWDDGGSGDYQETRNSLMSLRDNLQRKLEG